MLTVPANSKVNKHFTRLHLRLRQAAMIEPHIFLYAGQRMDLDACRNVVFDKENRNAMHLNSSKAHFTW